MNAPAMPEALAAFAHAAPEDLSNWWMPFTANRQFKARPRLFSAARGMYYYTPEGREVIDATAGLWCVNAGHGREEIAQAVYRQLQTLDFAPSFQMGHPLGFEFATRVCRHAPAGLDRIFFVNSGSEAVDTALKIALAYHRARGEGQRVRLIGRERGYHGVGFGGISVGGMVNNRRSFGAQLPFVDHLPHTHAPQHNAFSRGQPEWGAHLADELERIVALHGADTIAAVIVEPVAGSTGVLVPPKGYLEKLRALCDKHGILLIFDEVITGFGRLGQPFAAQALGVTPDMITCAKGITNGVLPMGAVLVDRRVHDAFMQGPAGAIEFFHGYTYSAHPVACAAGLATFDIYEREGLLQRAAEIAPYWEQAVHSLRDRRHVIDVRNLGLIAGVELEPRAGAPGARAFEAHVKGFETGVMLRFTGDIIAMSPPLIVEREHIDRIVDLLGQVLDSID